MSVAAQGDAVAANAAHLTAVMVAPFAGPDGLSGILDDARKNAVAFGPGAGVGAATAALAETILAHPNKPAAVLDADALTSFSSRPDLLARLIAGAERPVVLTPHEGEYNRLFKDLHEGTESDSELEATPSAAAEAKHQVDAAPSLRRGRARVQRARAAARASAAILCLKGPDTIVAAPDGRVSIIAAAPAWLATAGSGDVLTGMIAGLLAQGMPAFQAASAAVWMHAESARLFGSGLIAEDIPERLPAVWSGLLRS